MSEPVAGVLASAVIHNEVLENVNLSCNKLGPVSGGRFISDGHFISGSSVILICHSHLSFSNIVYCTSKVGLCSCKTNMTVAK